MFLEQVGVKGLDESHGLSQSFIHVRFLALRLRGEELSNGVGVQCGSGGLVRGLVGGLVSLLFLEGVFGGRDEEEAGWR